MKMVLAVVAAVLLFGYATSGGPVRRDDGSVDAGATLQRSAGAGGEAAGRGIDDVGNSLGHGVGSAVGNSDLAKVAAAGAAAAGVVKYGPKFRPKPVTVPALTPTTKPPKPKPETTQPTMTPTSTTAAPMSSGGFTVPSWSVPPATWKPCVGSLGVVVSC